MRILQLVMARQYRGAEIFAWQLSQQLTRAGEDILYVSLFDVQGKKFVPDGVIWKDLSAQRRRGINLSLMHLLAKVIREFNPQIIQANAGETLKYAVMAKLLFGLKFKLVFRNASMVSLYIKHSWQRWFNRFLYKQVDCVVSVSNVSLRDFVKTFPETNQKIKMIPNGIDLLAPRRISDFDSSVPNLVHVGGFSFEKNHAGLLRIFRQIKSKQPDAKLWLIGDGLLRKQAETMVKDLGISDIQFLGYVSNPMDYIISSAILLLPSKIEGLPGVILEAMYCRTPVVAYDVGGISEVVKNDVTGWLLKAHDEEEFIGKVLQVLQQDEQELDRIKNNAYNLVIQNFDNRVIAGRFLEVYQNLIR